MKTKFSRIISLLCAVIIATVCLIPVSAAEGTEYEAVNVALIATAEVSSAVEGYGAEMAIDGDTGTYWRASTNKAEYIILTWDTPMEIEYVTAILTNGNHVGNKDCSVSILKEGAEEFEPVSTTYTNESNSPVTMKFSFDEGAQTVKAVKFDMAKTDKNHYQMLEFQAYSRVDDSILTPEIKKYVNGDTMFIATTVPAEAQGKNVFATYTITRGGDSVTGTVEIFHAYEKIVIGEYELTPNDFNIEDPGEYVTGVFITNVKEGDDVDVSFSIYGETFIFLGSSVTYGANANGRSFVELIDEKYDDVTCVKLAVSGTALSVATTPNGTSYVERLVANADNYPVCDHLNVQLSSNDASAGRPLGTVSESKNKEDFDTTTIAGAIEYIIAFAQETWGCEVSFYANPKLINPSNGEVDGRDWYYEDMVEVLLQIKEKWGIRVLDMYHDEEMTNISLEDRAKYMADSIHPNATGYEEWWLPKFEEFLFGEE